MTFADQRVNNGLESHCEDHLQEIGNNHQCSSFTDDNPYTNKKFKSKHNKKKNENTRSSSNPIRMVPNYTERTSPLLLQPLSGNKRQISTSKRTRQSSIVNDNEIQLIVENESYIEYNINLDDIYGNVKSKNNNLKISNQNKENPPQLKQQSMVIRNSSFKEQESLARRKSNIEIKPKLFCENGEGEYLKYWQKGIDSNKELLDNSQMRNKQLKGIQKEIYSLDAEISELQDNLEKAIKHDSQPYMN